MSKMKLKVNAENESSLKIASPIAFWRGFYNSYILNDTHIVLKMRISKMKPKAKADNKSSLKVVSVFESRRDFHCGFI